MLKIYPNSLKNWNLGCAKAPGLNDRKSVNINNIDRLAIVQSRELSRQPKSNFLSCLGILLALILLVTMWGCACRENACSQWRQENGKVKVLTTIAMICDLVKQIGGENVDCIALIRGELDPHSYELVKGDDEKFARADLIFYNGLGLEHGLSLRQNLENNPKAIAVADPILKENPELIIKVDGMYDPHVWMDIALWTRTIDPIVNALSEKDPDHAPHYRERGEKLRLKMHEADQKMFGILQAIDPQRRFLVTSHDAFHYFTRHYLAEPGEENWSLRCRAPEGLAPEAQMSLNDVMAIIAHIEAFKIQFSFQNPM